MRVTHAAALWLSVKAAKRGAIVHRAAPCHAAALAAMRFVFVLLYYQSHVRLRAHLDVLVVGLMLYQAQAGHQREIGQLLPVGILVRELLRQLVRGHYHRVQGVVDDL